MNKCNGCNKQRELKEIENKFDPKRILLPNIILACDECYLVFESANKSYDSIESSYDKLQDLYKEYGM